MIEGPVAPLTPRHDGILHLLAGDETAKKITRLLFLVIGAHGEVHEHEMRWSPDVQKPISSTSRSEKDRARRIDMLVVAKTRY